MAKKQSPPQRLLVCNCQRTMELDGERLAEALGLEEPLTVHRELCRAGIEAFRNAAAEGQPLHVTCTQESSLFAEVAEELADETTPIQFTNIRETAGWSEAGGRSLPKMTALIAEAEHQPGMVAALTLKSSGVCLVYGPGQIAMETATNLAGRLSPILVLSDAGDALPPSRTAFPVFRGRIRNARGVLGQFSVSVENCARARPSSRDEFSFEDVQAATDLECDLILDVSGGKPLFTGHGRRDGYKSVDPDDPGALARAMFDISDLVGEFEKPKYISFDADICAHSRSGLVGCTNCLDVCPLGAISPAGDTVQIDPAICGGCGNCASVCPTGAAGYALPFANDVVARMSILLENYRKAGGLNPVLLAHDEKHGAEMISALARYGRGLPANVIPISLNSVLMLGHDLMSAALALGAESLTVLAPPQHPEELASLEQQASLANHMLASLGYGQARVRVLAEPDPDAVDAALYEAEPLTPMPPNSLVAVGSKREVARSVFAMLHDGAAEKPEIIQLPEGAPYGRVEVNVDGCTLCLACVSACPANALRDHPDKPQLAFVEQACVQCGVCVATCPEKVISLEPRFNFTSAAMSPVEIKTEEPFECISCGKKFGSKSAINAIVDRLRGHSMFKDEKQLELIQMCEDCRVEAIANSSDDPFAMGERPRMRTTDDYLAEESAAGAGGKKPEDFLG